MHWGDEYTHKQNAYQERMAAFLAQHNVDLVIGHHPHVLQPMVTLPRADGKQMLCFYSLGNFVSSQHIAPAMLGGMMSVTIKKEGGNITVQSAGMIPVVTWYANGFTGY
jgi:poly-gamma-glutamate synthesis protein (capsule biosynthesis protein)